MQEGTEARVDEAIMGREEYLVDAFRGGSPAPTSPSSGSEDGSENSRATPTQDLIDNLDGALHRLLTDHITSSPPEELGWNDHHTANRDSPQSYTSSNNGSFLDDLVSGCLGLYEANVEHLDDCESQDIEDWSFADSDAHEINSLNLIGALDNMSWDTSPRINGWDHLKTDKDSFLLEPRTSREMLGDLDGLEDLPVSSQILGDEPDNMPGDMPFDLNGCEYLDADGATITLELQTSSRGFFSSSHYSDDVGTFLTAAPQAHQNRGFLTLVSAVCEIYKSGQYLSMMLLNKIEFTELGAGVVFKVSKGEMMLTGYSPRNHQLKETFLNRIVIKRNDKLGGLTQRQVNGFVKELRVLHHLGASPFVVDLRGVGWFEESTGKVDDSRWYKPALILEEAFDTLDYLIGPFANPSYSDLLEVFGHITSGLLALHKCGIAHGDLKPQNILLFKRPILRGGLQGEAYLAKISDFESAVFQSSSESELLLYPPGTVGYRAPEADQGKQVGSFLDLLLADTWSLGMVFAVTLSRRKATEFQGQRAAEWARNRVNDIRRNMESSTSESRYIEIASSILENTLQVKPASRNLDIVFQQLKDFVLPNTQANGPGVMTNNYDEGIHIGHETLKVMGGPFRDNLVSELKLIVETSTQARRVEALWELGVIYTTRFADPSASIDQGLSWILQAAQAGDIRAKALCHRLHEAFGRPCPCEPKTCLQRLEDAAIGGHRAALAELMEVDSMRATKSQATSALRLFDVTDPGGLKWPLHRAAASGASDEVCRLLDLEPQLVNVVNDEADTPLILACQFGQAGIVRLLLERGADSKIRNDFGENALHYAWCFNAKEGPDIIQNLVQNGAGIYDVSIRDEPISDLDILPVLPGTPIERAAGRIRFDLVHVFARLGGLSRPLSRRHKEMKSSKRRVEPSNGRMARRLLLLGLRLHDAQLVDFILENWIRGPNYDDTLTPIHETTWLHGGAQRSLLDASCAVWVSHSGLGSEYPARFWLACRHGAAWRQAMRSSVMRLLHHLPQIREGDVDRSISWAMKESFHDAFIALLHCKFELGGHDGPGCSIWTDLSRFRWILGAFNVSAIEPQEVHLIDQLHFHASDDHDTTDYDSSNSSRTDDHDDDEVKNKGEPRDISHGTMAQEALIHGDRYLFRLLTDRYRANAKLPICAPKNCASREPINLYTRLAYTDHKDIWFAKELGRLGVPLYCPWDINPYDQHGLSQPRTSNYKTPLFPGHVWLGNQLRLLRVPVSCPWASDRHRQPYVDQSGMWNYRTPLVHALGVSSIAYVNWLLSLGGASLEEKVSGTQTILHSVMASGSQSQIAFFFKGCESYEGGAAFLPSKYREDGGTEVLSLFLEANCPGSKTLADGTVTDLKPPPSITLTPNLVESLRSDRVDDQSCYLYLLQRYPHAAIPLDGPFFKALGTLFRIKGANAFLKIEGDGDVETDSPSGRIMEKIREDHAQRRSQTRWGPRAAGWYKLHNYGRSIMRYFWITPEDRLSGPELLFALSLIPPGSLPPSSLLRMFSPGFFWWSSLRAYVWMGCGALGVAFLSWIRLEPLGGFYQRAEVWGGPLLALLLRFANRVFVAWLWIADIGASLALALYLIQTCVAELGDLLEFSGSVDWRYILLTVSVFMPTVLGVGLAIVSLVIGFKMKQQFGHVLIPYIL